jgi:hypothetical protein
MIAVRSGTTLQAERPVTWPFAAPRLEGRVHGGRLEVALWGCGAMGHLTLPRTAGPGAAGPEAAGPWRVRPNTLETPAYRVVVARSCPTLLLDGLAPAGVRVVPARRPSASVRESVRALVEDTPAGRAYRLPWGVLLVRRQADGIRLAAGEDLEEARRALALPDETLLREARDYEQRCDCLPEASPLLRSMAAFGLHAALSAVKCDPHGGFAGVAAGPGYSLPARSYYRDGYWTAQALMQVTPESVRGLLAHLASGVQETGEAPSGVIVPGPFQAHAWESLRSEDRGRVRDHRRPLDWWSDHFDSPALFVLLLAEYVAATGDREQVSAYWAHLQAIYHRYDALDRDRDGVPEKPRNDRDWADNVYRSGPVTYDVALYHGALRAIAVLAEGVDDTLRDGALKRAGRVRTVADRRLWQAGRGHYVEYVSEDGFVEDHLAIDTLTAVRFGLADAAQARALLQAVRRSLETRHNAEQPYGDWGVMSVWPPYRRRRDLRSKSAFAYRYHNGADWPYWDGVYADLLLKAGMPGWEYPLLRWWEYGLAQGWASPVEYYSPPYGPGALLQAWSSVPAAVALKQREQVVAAAKRWEERTNDHPGRCGDDR